MAIFVRWTPHGESLIFYTSSSERRACSRNKSNTHRKHLNLYIHYAIPDGFDVSNRFTIFCSTFHMFTKLSQLCAMFQSSSSFFSPMLIIFSEFRHLINVGGLPTLPRSYPAFPLAWGPQCVAFFQCKCGDSLQKWCMWSRGPGRNCNFVHLKAVGGQVGNRIGEQ